MLSTVEAMNLSFKESFFLPVQNNDKALAKDLVVAQIRSALKFGELWVAQLINPGNEVGVIGVACWYGRGQLMPLGDDKPYAPWEQNMLKLDEGQQLTEYRGKLKSKGRIWWDKFYEAFDTMADEGLGVGGKRAGYHLQLFGVHPSYQRQGVGSALDKAVEDSAKASTLANGTTVLCLETTGQEGISIYEKMGYTVVARAVVPSKDSGEELTMPFVCMKKEVHA